MLVTLMMVKNVKPLVDKYSATHMNGIIGAEQLMSQQIGMTVPQLCQVNFVMLPAFLQNPLITGLMWTVWMTMVGPLCMKQFWANP